MALNTPGDPDYIGYTGDVAPTTTPQRRFNTTPAWGDPYHAPSPGDPYYAEWRAANPGIPESAAEPIGNQVDVYGNPYGQKPHDPTTDPGPAAPPAPVTGGGSLIAPFTGQYTPAGSASPNPTPLPTVEGSVATIPGAPTVPTIPRFTAPTIDEAMADPGYKFVLDQGNTNLQNWAAARGTLNDSSTAKALIDYGQGAATTQYGNVWDRAMNAYQTNTQTQYLDPFAAQFQNWATGTVNPTMSQYQTNAANVAHLNDVSWQDNWNSFQQQFRQFQDQRDSTFNKQFQTATA